MDCYSYKAGKLAYGIQVATDAAGDYVALIKESHARGAKPRRLVGLRLLQGGAA